MQIEVEGLAAHAGAAPEQGISAIAIASLAIADLVRGGWHGLISKGDKRGTSNVGFIQVAKPRTSFTDRVELKAEARSHDKHFRKQIVAMIQQAFEKAAAEVQSAAGRHGKVRFHGRQDYEAFRLPNDEPAVLAAERAVRTAGLEPVRGVSKWGIGRQLDDRPRHSHRHPRMRPVAYSHHERVSRHRGF